MTKSTSSARRRMRKDLERAATLGLTALAGYAAQRIMGAIVGGRPMRGDQFAAASPAPALVEPLPASVSSGAIPHGKPEIVEAELIEETAPTQAKRRAKARSRPRVVAR